MSVAQRVLSPIVEVREEEAQSLLLMFLYSFLVMTSYNIVKPLTRAQFIDELGADNLPWVLLASGVLVAVMMQLYSRGVARLPPKSVLATTQFAIAIMLVGFWALFGADVPGTSVAFYLVAQILGLLLISQFWLLANEIYDARQAKRLFGFIGGGASLGGMTGSALLAFTVDQFGTGNLLLVSAALLVVCSGVVTLVVRVSPSVELSGVGRSGQKTGVGGREAFRMLRESRHLQLISMIIAFAAIGAGLLEQQLNMAVEETQGDGGADSVAAFLGQVQLYLSITGFVIQVWLTSRIHRYLGIGFAMLILPIGLASTGVLILATAVLPAAAAGRILDTSLRYTVDKTTREILFLPLPADTKRQAKQFVDVTVDRFAKGVGAAVTLVLIQPWGLGLSWPQLSWVSLGIAAVWVVGAKQAHRQYLASFRRSIARQGVEPTEVRLNVADLSTVETLVEELAHPDEPRVLYAIDVLESIDKQNLVTPLLLRHDSVEVRVRALAALSAARGDIAERWVPAIERLVKDPNAEVRAAAVRALASVRNEDAAAIARGLIDDPDPRIVATAAVVLAASETADDRQAAERALSRLASDLREGTSRVRRDLAAIIRQVGSTQSHDLLIPLLHDPNPDVADEAMRSVRALERADFRFAPTLVSLLGNRRLKGGARDTLERYGEPAVDVLTYFLQDPQEDVWVRRHIPATLARIPCQASMDALCATLETPDGFLRFKTVTAIERLRREHPALAYDKDPIERLALAEGRSYFNRLGLHYNLFTRATMPTDSMLARALDEKLVRSVDRIYRLLGLLYPWKDVAAARWAIEHGDARARAGALEYLDNVLSSQLRSRLIPVLEDAPIEAKIRRGNVILKTRPRDVEETLLELINDDDQVVAATAIDLVGTNERWELRDDVEHVLAHRHAADWYVFEAASWALAAHALTPDRRRTQWRESLPATAVVGRMRGLGLFASVGIDELFRIAGAGHQVRHASGTVLFHEGSAPDQLHLLLDGSVMASGRQTGAREIRSPAAVGFEESLDGCLASETIKTTGPAVTLSLSNDELRTLLADNTDLVQGLFRTLAERRETLKGLLKGTPSIELERYDGQRLTSIQKNLALRRIPLFAQLTGVEMLHLSTIAHQVDLEAGATFTDETAPVAVGIVLNGDLRLETGDGARTVWRAGAGDILGMYETLSGTDARLEQLRLVATKPTAVLQVDRDELFDLLGQRPDLLQQMFAAIFDRHDAAARPAT